MIYPKPYSVYLRGAIYFMGQVNSCQFTAGSLRICWHCFGASTSPGAGRVEGLGRAAYIARIRCCGILCKTYKRT